jgi:hypothetical protein
MKESILISASCTTSWFDWIHGELWLCPDGMLRRSLGLWMTARHFVGPTVDPDDPPRRSFSTAEIVAIVGAGTRNRWIPWSRVRFARLKQGPMDNSLHLELVDGRREKFLWLGVDGGKERLADAFAQFLPGRWVGPNEQQHDNPLAPPQ